MNEERLAQLELERERLNGRINALADILHILLIAVPDLRAARDAMLERGLSPPDALPAVARESYAEAAAFVLGPQGITPPPG